MSETSQFDDKNGASGESDSLKQAAMRLNAALQAFENTIAQRRQKELKAEKLEEQVTALNASLAAERERARKLADANDAVTARLDEMIDVIEGMLAAR